MARYEQYLRSPEFAVIRRAADERAGGLCELCQSAAKETHHIKYPRGYAQDSASNVLRVCSQCHRRLHGMTDLTTDHALTEIDAKIGDRVVRGLHIDERRWLWASVQAWENALRMPAPLRARLFATLGQRAMILTQDRNEPHAMADPKGESWYRWAAINDALGQWYYRTEPRVRSQDKTLTDDDRYFFGNVGKLRAWGDALQEAALVRAASSAGSTVGHPYAGSNEQRLALAIQEVAGIALQHEQRLSVVESKVLRDPMQFVSVRQFLFEAGLDADQLVPGTRQGIGQWLGVFMAEHNAPKGPKVQWRMPNSSVVAEVNSFRRRDLEYGLQKVPGLA